MKPFRYSKWSSGGWPWSEVHSSRLCASNQLFLARVGCCDFFVDETTFKIYIFKRFNPLCDLTQVRVRTQLWRKVENPLYTVSGLWMGEYFSVWGLILTTGLELVHPHSLPETTSKLPWIPIQFERIRYTKSRDVTWFGPAWPMTCRMTSVGLSHRITWTQHRLLCFQSWSITSDPGLGPLVFIQSRVDTQPPPLRCRVTFNLSSEKTSLPPLNALNYPAGLPAGLVFPTMPFLSMGQFWRRDYSPCIRKITAIPPPTPLCGFKSGRIMLPIRYSAAENSVIQPWNNTDTTWSHTWRFLYSTGGKMISTLFLS